MTLTLLLDLGPDPVGLGIAAVVILFVIGFVLLLAGGLVFFLWYRKRCQRQAEMIRPETQPNNPNQP